MAQRRALPRALALALATAIALLAGCSSSSASATDPCAAARDVVAVRDSAYQAAFAAARACDPSAGAAQCPGSTVSERCGCPLPSNADATKRATLTTALADLEAAETAQSAACGGFVGTPCPGGCPGAVGPTAACVSTGDAGGGVCGYQ